MPDINRIRVNNVKYNFGTQYYDDFTMRLYGKNTLYDLANGGGKSVLMLLLLQNLIPNCTLDDKQPIEKLFRTGNKNTVIHSLIEWNLDEDDIKEGYRYMTTGFCAKKANDQAEDENGVASVEYFNYCIFYRDYNKNDIINLPLTKDGERISYYALRAYLKELEHHSQELLVKVFDRKGEYQRFISGYGLHESQWEIIRGINRTEGHVRTYFETNYRTTRKVVEDLLIEEIIEKAFMVKTEREESAGDSMADTLVDIKDRLALLAKKKKDIADYDHQRELIGLFSDRIKSFSEIYRETEAVSGRLAGIYLAGREYAAESEKREAELERERLEKTRQRDSQTEKLECLRVSRDKRSLEALKADIELLEKNRDGLTESKKRVEDALGLEVCKGYYAEYLEEEAGYRQCEAELNELKHKGSMGGDSSQANRIQLYAAALKDKLDGYISELKGDMERLISERDKLREKSEYYKKAVYEASLQQAVRNHDLENEKAGLEELSAKLSKESMSLSTASLEDIKTRIKSNLMKQEELNEKAIQVEDELKKEEEGILALRAEKSEKDGLMLEKEGRYAELSAMAEKYASMRERIEKLMEIYGGSTLKELRSVIEERLNKSIGDLNDSERELAGSKKRAERLKNGILTDVSAEAERVIDYIATRHGSYAMYGADYISVLPQAEREALLRENPLLPYGVLAKDFDRLSEDEALREFNAGSNAVNIYDMDNLSERGIIHAGNVMPVSASPELFTNPDMQEALIKAENENINEIKEKITVIKDTAQALKSDLMFIPNDDGAEFLSCPAESEKLKAEMEEYRDILAGLDKRIKQKEDRTDSLKKTLEEISDMKQLATNDERVLRVMSDISDEIEEKEKNISKLKESIRSLTENRAVQEKSERETAISLTAVEAALDENEKRLAGLEAEWQKYAAYYPEKPVSSLPDNEDIRKYSTEELKAKINIYAEGYEKELEKTEDKQSLMRTMEKGMKRILDIIKGHGVDVSELAGLAEKGEIYRADERLIHEYEKERDRLCREKDAADRLIADKNREADRLEGSIEYAIKNIEAAYGSFTEDHSSVSEITAMLNEGEEALKSLKEAVRLCEESCRTYKKEQGYMTDLYKDAKRIIEMNGIDLSSAVPDTESADNLRAAFEDALVRFDRSKKQSDKARRELERFRQTVSDTLYESGAAELAKTIRENAEIPETLTDAKKLMEGLTEIMDYIKLEKDGIEKGLYDMELLKTSFEEQCIQRCMDVKTELDKLEKLSRIVLDGEPVKMLDLNVPYVKQEFMRQRMSDYIDDIVKRADSLKDDRERRRYIRNALSLKKLFGVIVTDMNQIKLSLYKRERISKNSRYLRYEEAVGSTGQSQGIYIQFLISIINYISGMYKTGDNGQRTGTIFIDNPFGAAKDIYIWEPIFALLKANNIQLIVPARGATPLITGRFDINYVLGQRMEGDRQLTVVVDYTAATEQEALEYHELNYEQETFDFI